MKQQRLSRAFVFLILAIGAFSIWIPVGCDKLVTEITNNTVYDTTLGLACLSCHSDASNMLARPQAQWENSRHANGDLIDVSVDINGQLFSVNQCGAQCHSHEQFVKDVDSVSITIDKLSPITCFTCHKPHSGAYGTWSIDSLRGWDNFVRLANDSVYQFGKSSSCAHCHSATGEPPVAAVGIDSVLLPATWGPHWSPQADVFGGTGGHRFKDSTFESRHESLLKTQHGCLKCHFGSGQGTHFAEHTFRLEDTVANQPFVGNCNVTGCHFGGAAPVVSDFYDFPILDSIARYSDSLETLLRSRNILDSTDAAGLKFYPDAWVRVTEAQVLFNYLMYKFDGSRGIHNPEYMDFLLRQSVAYWDSIPPEGQFVADITSGCVPFDVQFTATYSGLIDSVLWEFEDGFTDTARQPLHTFTTAGVRSIVLRVYGPAGTGVTARQSYILANKAPLADFTADKLSGCDTMTVQFASTSTGTVTSWAWDFGDDSTSIEQNPAHKYLSTGVYSVSLITTGPCGVDSASYDSLITIVSTPPLANFGMDTTTGCDSLAVVFSDSSTGDIDVWKWLFGDGDSSFVQNPTHTYLYRQINNIPFYPALITTGPCGVDTSISAVAITISTLPVAAFSADSTTISVNSQLGFLDESTGAVGAIRIWDFGDGIADTTTNEFAIHTYTIPNTYTVTLTVTNGCGQDIEQKINYITVQ
jgi:PKD repeat protein